MCPDHGNGIIIYIANFITCKLNVLNITDKNMHTVIKCKLGRVKRVRVCS